MPFEVREVSCHTYEEFTGKEAIPFIQYYVDEEGNFYEDTDLDFNLDPPQPEATISEWVARDRDGSLSLYQSYPERQENLGYWRDGLGESELSEMDFPSLSWQDDPIEVEITIKPKKQ